MSLPPYVIIRTNPTVVLSGASACTAKKHVTQTRSGTGLGQRTGVGLHVSALLQEGSSRQSLA